MNQTKYSPAIPLRASNSSIVRIISALEHEVTDENNGLLMNLIDTNIIFATSTHLIMYDYKQNKAIESHKMTKRKDQVIKDAYYIPINPM